MEKRIYSFTFLLLKQTNIRTTARTFQMYSVTKYDNFHNLFFFVVPHFNLNNSCHHYIKGLYAVKSRRSKHNHKKTKL